MTLDEIWSRAREIMKPNCRACKVCNGVACRGEIPGVGAMGDGSSWTNCVEFLSRIKLNMDTVYESCGQDTSMEIFGHRFNAPVFAAPIGGMSPVSYTHLDVYKRQARRHRKRSPGD